MDVSAQNKWKKKSLEKQPQMTALTFRVFLFLPSFQGNVSKACTFTLFEKATSLLKCYCRPLKSLPHTPVCLQWLSENLIYKWVLLKRVWAAALFFPRYTISTSRAACLDNIYPMGRTDTHTNFMQFINEVLAATQVNRDDVFKDFIF